MTPNGINFLTMHLPYVSSPAGLSIIDIALRLSIIPIIIVNNINQELDVKNVTYNKN